MYEICLSSFQEAVLSGLIVTGVSALLTWIFYLIKGNLKEAQWIKRNVYNKCRFLYKNVHIPNIARRIIAYLVNLFYFHNRELIHKQQCIVENILNDLNNTLFSPPKVYWIQGSSYSGKTTTVLNLLIDLISKLKYNQLFQKLDGNIFYYDLGNPNIKLDALLNDYEIEKYSNCLMIFDNLHKLSGKSCLHIIENIVLNNHAFALIILLRYPEEFLSENECVNELKRMIAENGTGYFLNTLKTDDFKIYHEKQFILFCQHFFSMEQVNANNSIMIHLYILYVKKEFDTLNMIPEIQSFLNKESQTITMSNSIFIALIACSLFTGSFTFQLLEKCLPDIPQPTLKKILKSLTKIGFLTNYPNSFNDYYFHEQLAKAYFKVSIKNLNYRDIYIQIFQNLSKEFKEQNNSVLIFLYYMLAQDSFRAQKIYENAVINANFLNLFNEMMFLFDNSVCDISEYYKEIGILCDRCGKLQEARKFYSFYLDKEKSADAFYKLVQIDHKIIDKYPEIKKTSLNNSDFYIKSLSNYWEIHVNIHRGEFEFEKLINLAYEVQNNVEKILENHLYDGIHLMRRLYFDIFRLYFLEGIFQPEKLRIFTDRNSRMYEILNYQLEEFEAYYIKFAIGLMLGQDVLFCLAFENKGLELEEYKFLFKDYLNIEHSQTYDFKAIANETIRIYTQAIELLDKIGDKTAIFVKYHMYNIKLLLVENGDYSECERFYQDYMTFATKENILEYQAYAETFKLKMSLIQLCSPAIIVSYGNDQYDELKNIVQQKLELAKKYEELASPKIKNSYAQLRLNLYSTLFSLLIHKMPVNDFKKKIKNMKKIAQSMKYNRELKLIKYIEKYDYELSMESVKNIFLYYPIVPQ